MKAFDEWDDNTNLMSLRFCCMCAEEKGRYDGWKAALKWVLNHPDTDLLDYDLAFIEEELEGE